MRTLSLLFLAACVHVAHATHFTFARVDVARGVHAFIEPYGHAVVSGNVVLVVGDAAAMLVDSGHHPAVTREIAAEVRRITAKPVRYLVNTHWHNDHVAGNAVIAEAFPEAQVVAHRFTAEVMEREIRAYQGPGCRPFIEAQARIFRDMLASGLGPEGQPLEPARRERYVRILRDADESLEDCARFRYRGPDLLFDERITLRLGGRDVDVLHAGRGNTAGDALVRVADAGVVVTGDVLVHPVPFAFQGHVAEWAAVLRRIEGWTPTAIVPGHGPVFRDLGYLRRVAALLEGIDAQVRAAYTPGMPLAQLRERVDLSAHRAALAGDDAALRASFDALVAGPALARAWQAAAGKLEPEGLPRP